MENQNNTMKRIGYIHLVPATKIVKGYNYIACLHMDTAVTNRSIVVAQRDEDSNQSDDEIWHCAFENGNTYPYMKKELYDLVFEYEVNSLADSNKVVGKNCIKIHSTEYPFLVQNHVQPDELYSCIIDFDTNTASIQTGITKLDGRSFFSVIEVIEILKNLKTQDDIDNKIAKLSKIL